MPNIKFASQKMKAIPLHKKLLKGFIKVANWERTSKKKTAKTT